jgi:hypothetical protein
MCTNSNVLYGYGGETPEEALKHLHDEVEYHFSQDNNLIALESDEGEMCEEEK